MRLLYINIFKRIIDLFGAIGLLFLFFIPIVVIAITLVIIHGSHRVFFTQFRPGKNEVIFELYKFKTMADSHDMPSSLPTSINLATKLGQFLRNTSLDELPQLLNVIKGDMSLIGPRPLLVEYLPLYKVEHRIRHNVRPGLTGWAQINGRKSLSWDKKFELDAWYVTNISFLVDLKIFLMTITYLFKFEHFNSKNEIIQNPFVGFSNNQNLND